MCLCTAHGGHHYNFCCFSFVFCFCEYHGLSRCVFFGVKLTVGTVYSRINHLLISCCYCRLLSFFSGLFSRVSNVAVLVGELFTSAIFGFLAAY